MYSVGIVHVLCIVYPRERPYIYIYMYVCLCGTPDISPDHPVLFTPCPCLCVARCLCLCLCLSGFVSVSVSVFVSPVFRVMCAVSVSVSVFGSEHRSAEERIRSDIGRWDRGSHLLL